MHPEIVREEPGSCPISGMALESRIVTGEEENESRACGYDTPLVDRLALTVPIFFLAMSEMIPGEPVQHTLSPRALTWLQLVLATPVVLWGAGPFSSAAGLRSPIAASTCSP